MPKVSVIIPVYNTEKYLRECLDSVVNQTFNDIEIICVNDGSTDGSLTILNEYAKKDSRIKVISQENRGLAAARNTGLEYVTAPYVYFLDSDDFVETSLLNYAITIFESFDIDYFVFGSKAFIDDKKCCQSLEGMNRYIEVKRDGLYDVNIDIGRNTNIHVWNKVFKTELIKKYNIKFIEGLLYEDIYFMWYYLFLSKKAYFETEPFHHYRMRSTSIMENVTRNKAYETAIHHMYNWNELFHSVSQSPELFLKNFDNLRNLLFQYSIRTKELVPPLEKYKVEKLKIEYSERLQEKYRDALKLRYRGLEKLFSVKNPPDYRYKVLCVCGIKVKFRRRKLFQ